MASFIIMPKQGQSVESCILTELKKHKGDHVSKGELLFSYETDKAAFEELAAEEGVVLDVFFKEGDEIPVLQNVLVIGAPGEQYQMPEGAVSADAVAVDAVSADAGTISAAGTSSVVAAVQPAQGAAPAGVYVPSATGAISPRARQLAAAEGIDCSRMQGSGPQGRIITRDVQAVLDRRGPITPLAKKIMAEQSALGVNFAGAGIGSGAGIGTGTGLAGTGSIVGTGLAGTFTASDVMSVQASTASPSTSSAGASVAGVAGSSSEFELKTLSNMRKRIAKAMHASLQNSAQLTHHLSADARRMLELREAVKKAMAQGFTANITLNDMVCFATIKALKKFPQVNAHFLGDQVRQYHPVHLGVAVDTERGLMVPTIKNADTMSIVALSNKLKELADACKKGNVDPDLLSSEAASFTVSNLGNYGVEIFTPIINLPQVAILGVNTIVPRPKDIGNGVYAFVPHMGLSLTYDHRALDGGEATRFVKQIAIELENLIFEFH